MSSYTLELWFYLSKYWIMNRVSNRAKSPNKSKLRPEIRPSPSNFSSRFSPTRPWPVRCPFCIFAGFHSQFDSTQYYAPSRQHWHTLGTAWRAPRRVRNPPDTFVPLTLTPQRSCLASCRSSYRNPTKRMVRTGFLAILVPSTYCSYCRCCSWQPPTVKVQHSEVDQKLESNIKIYSKHIQVEMQKIEDVNRDIIL